MNVRGIALLSALLAVAAVPPTAFGQTDYTLTGHRRTVVCPAPCPCPPAPGQVAPAPTVPGQETPVPPGGETPTPAPGEMAPPPAQQPSARAPQPSRAPSSNTLARSFPSTPSGPSMTPGMVGDFFGGGFIAVTTGYEVGAYGGPVTIAGGDRRFKVIEHLSPLPTDRFFYDYHHFQNAFSGVDLTNGVRDYNFDRHVFGVEKTCLSEMASLELRIPFGTGLDSAQPAYSTGEPLDQDTEFGNIVLMGKCILAQRGSITATAGLGIGLPTAADQVVYYSPNDIAFEISNNAVHLQPFGALIWTPNDRLFGQFYAACDFGTSGNTVHAQNAAQTLVYAGKYNDQNWLSLDFKLGYWLYRSRVPRFISGIAPTLELHYTTTIEDFDAIYNPGIGFALDTPFGPRQDVLNLTGGLHFEIRNRAMLNAYAAVPLSRDEAGFLGSELKNSFDAEVGLQFTWYR